MYASQSQPNVRRIPKNEDITDSQLGDFIMLVNQAFKNLIVRVRELNTKKIKKFLGSK